MDTFGAGSNCPFKSDVHLLESQIKGVTKAGTNHRCPFLLRCLCYRGIRKERVDCSHIQITKKYFWLRENEMVNAYQEVIGCGNFLP